MANKSKKLQELARIFAPYATLYAVGGVVRDMLLDVECYDIDITSKLKVDKVKSILLNTVFEISDKSLRMGTMVISSENLHFEYTTFRSESYSKSSGAHYPKEVEFTEDILLDAKRRDFKANAIYYDILKDEIVDVIHGVDDIKNKVLSTCDEPSIVFEADGLRILRLVRFCAELGFSPDEKTLSVAKKNAWRVKDIAIERIRDELKKIFVADTRHKELGLNDAHLRGLRLLDELGLVEMLLPELHALKGIAQPKRYHLYDAYEHSVKAYEIAPPHLRMVALLHDIGKVHALRVDGTMHSHEIFGERMARDVMTRLKFSNNEIERVSRLVRWHMIDINGNMSVNKLKKFVVEQIDIIEDLILLKDVDGIASAGALTRENRLRTAYNELKANNIPLRIKDLKVSGQDLIDLGIKPQMRATVLKQLLIDTAQNFHLNDRDVAMRHLERIVKNL